MNSETRRRALRAAAKVAFGAAFVSTLPGCGGQAMVDGGRGSQPGADSGGSTADSASKAAGAGADTAPTPAPAGYAEPANSAADAAPTPAPAGYAEPANSAADAGLRCLGAVELQVPPASSTPISEAEFACCRDYANASITSLVDAGLGGTVDTDPSFVNCCKALIAGVDSGLPLDKSENVYAYPARDACCASSNHSAQIELWQHRFCAPWGPPVPPALVLTRVA